MKLAGIDNVFGTDVFTPPASAPRSTYYKGLRLPDRVQMKALRAPKPLSHTIKNFLLTYNG